MVNEKRLDLIDRKALAARYVELDYNTAGTPWTLRDVLNFLELAPTVDAVEVVHARWVYNGRSDEYFCSNCYKPPISFRREMNCGVGELVEVCFSDYCPNCGVKMDGGNEDG